MTLGNIVGGVYAGGVDATIGMRLLQNEFERSLKGPNMHIEISTDNNISRSEGLTSHIKGLVQNALAHFGDQITRVEVHLSDANAGKTGPEDKHCLIEARLAGRKPTAVTHVAATIDQAARGAADKLKH